MVSKLKKAKGDLQISTGSRRLSSGSRRLSTGSGRPALETIVSQRPMRNMARHNSQLSTSLRGCLQSNDTSSDSTSVESKEEPISKTKSDKEMVLFHPRISQGSENVMLLNVSDETSTLMPDTLRGSVEANGGCFVSFLVQMRQGENICTALERSVGGKIPLDTLVVCQLQYSVLETPRLFDGLGSFFGSFVGESGLVLIVDYPESENLKYNTAKTALLFELAGAGLIPGGDRKHNIYNRLAVYFQKVPFSIRHPDKSDVSHLLVIDQDSWAEPMQYPSVLLESWVQNNSNGIILMEDSDGKIIGAMYTQRIQNGGVVDSMPWKYAIAETAGLVEKPKDSNISNDGMTKQLMRVSTKQGGGGVDKYVPGTTLREFALNVAAAEGINEVVAITRANNYIFDEAQPEGHFESYLDSVKEGLKHDRGLNFHLSRGAEIVRKTSGKWIPEDVQNGGDGVIVRYELKNGTCAVAKEDDLKAFPDILTADAIEEAVKDATGRVLDMEREGLDDDASFMDLGADSLSIVEIASQVQIATGAEVTAQTLFRSPSINSLVSHLNQAVPQAQRGGNDISEYGLVQGCHTGRLSASQRSSRNRHRSNVDRLSSSQRSQRRQHTTHRSFSLHDRLNRLDPSQHRLNNSYSSEESGAKVGLDPMHDGFEGLEIAFSGSNSEQYDIAVTGMSCRFPGGVSCLDEYWQLMMKGANTSSTVPFGRWDAHSHAEHSNLSENEKKRVLFGSFVSDIEYFDPSFFGISTSEAMAMSPLQRIVLETAYLALRDAGYSDKEMKGLDCGVFLGNWVDSNSCVHKQCTSGLSVYSATGSSTSIASGRISYLFDFKGPNAVYDAACASSLVALDAAITALKEGKCAVALVIGANELFDSRVFESNAKAGMLSPTGRCHAFDASADGYLRGEGCGALVLKESSKAKLGSVYANILASSIMSDGASASITAPNGASQERLINRALVAAGISPSDVDYIEAHGTGTALGDPIEVDALAEVFAKFKNGSNPLIVGSVKANIGHLEGAAGIAGLIKAVLVLQHKMVPPNAALETINPCIQKTVKSRDFAVYFNTKSEPLAASANKLLIAGVSSFGYSGTICHTILQQAPAHVRRDILSTEQCRGAVDVAFLFTGQGSQYIGMGKDLYQKNKVFRESMDRCSDIAKSLSYGDSTESLLDTIFYSTDKDLLNNAQMALISIEWSLAQMWLSMNVSPAILLGHSVGEIAAACVAGAFSIDTALKMVIERTRLVSLLPRDNCTMAAVRCSLANANAAISSLEEHEQNLVGIGSVNGLNSLVLSGARDVVDKVLFKLGKRGHHLSVSHAFHSPLMSDMEDAFRSIIKSLDMQHPLTTPLSSTVTGEVFQVGDIIDAKHWVKQLTAPVLFVDAFDAAMKNSSLVDTIIEIGPKPLLTKLAKALNSDREELQWIVSLEDGVSTNIGKSLALVEDTGTPSNHAFPNRCRLPWPESTPHPLLQKHLLQPMSCEFHTVFHEKLLASFGNHIILGQNIFPVSGYVEMGLAAALLRSSQGTAVELVDIQFIQKLDVVAGKKMISICNDGNGMTFYDMSLENNESVVATISQINHNASGISAVFPLSLSLDDLKDSHALKVNLDEDNPHCNTYQTVEAVWLSEDGMSALARVDLPAGVSYEHDIYYHVHPALLDGATFQVLSIVSDLDGGCWAPISIAHVVIHHACKPTWAHLVLVEDGPTAKKCRVNLLDENGLHLVSIDGFCCSVDSSGPDASIYTAEWIETPCNSNRIKDAGLSSVAIVQLSGCQPCVSLDDSKVLTVQIDDIASQNLNTLPATLVVPIANLKPDIHADSSSVIEETLLLLQILSNMKDISRRLCFWTYNAEGPCILNGNAKESHCESSRLVGSSIWGMVRSMALEISPSMSIVCVDADRMELNMLSRIATELDEDNGDVEVSFRSNTRLVRRLKPLRDTTMVEKIAQETKYDIGIAIISGGLGGLGLVTAELMIELGAQHVILVSRSAKTKSYAGQNMEERLEHLLDLDDGKRVSVASCDFSNEGGVKSLLDQVRERHGAINTIIHASGLLNDGLFKNMTPEAVKSTHGPKAAGAWYIHKHTLSDDVRHFIVFSSIAAVFGNPGQTNYSASNAYLDGLVRLRCNNGLPAHSIQWPAIADVGMAAAMAVPSFSTDEQLPLSQVKVVLQRVLRTNYDAKRSTTTCPIPLPLIKTLSSSSNRIKRFMSGVNATNSGRTPVSSAKQPASLSTTSSVWSLEEILVKVEAAVKTVVSVADDEPIDHEMSLLDMGLDSLGTAELSSVLQTCFNVELSKTIALSHPTIADLSYHLHGFFAQEPSSTYSNKDLGSLTAGWSNFERPVEILSDNNSTTSKPKVLFFHGAYTNPKVAQILLRLKGFDEIFDFVIPAGNHEGVMCPTPLFKLLGIDVLEKMGLYNKSDKFWGWGGCWEIMNEDPASIPAFFKDTFQNNLTSYVREIDSKYGPFDGVVGFCEGGSALNTLLGMREAGKLNGALDSVRFFIHMAPWITPMGGKYGTASKSIPTLSVFGKHDMEDFVKASATYHKGFRGYFDEYSHEGNHNYPELSKQLKSKIQTLLQSP